MSGAKIAKRRRGAKYNAVFHLQTQPSTYGTSTDRRGMKTLRGCNLFCVEAETGLYRVMVIFRRAAIRSAKGG